MNGIHDLGGGHGFGPVPIEYDEPYFHHDWERRLFPLFAALFAGGHFNVDEFRHAIERMDPAHYLQSSYYEHWLHAFETLLVEKGTITLDELRGRAGPVRPAAAPAVLTAANVEPVVMTGASARVEHAVAARFKVGDRVRAQNLNPTTHIRLPRYVRGKTGRIVLHHGVFATPDAMAHGQGERPQHVYSVHFTAQELWGAARPDTLRIDLWDSYLEAA